MSMDRYFDKLSTRGFSEAGMVGVGVAGSV